MDSFTVIYAKLQELTQCSDMLNNIVRKFLDTKEGHAITMENYTVYYRQFSNPTLGTNLNPEMQSRIQAELNKLAATLRTEKECMLSYENKFLSITHHVVTHLREVQSQVLDKELLKWKEHQQLYKIGMPAEESSTDAAATQDWQSYLKKKEEEEEKTLSSIQELCESLADLIWKSKQQIIDIGRETQNQMFKEKLPAYLNEYNKLLSSLIASTFVIDKQPNQVIKTYTKFTATVRLLVGKTLGVNMNPPRVTVSIVSVSELKKQVPHAQTQVEPLPELTSRGEIVNSSATMEYNSSTRQFQAFFRNMQIKKVKRAEKKGNEAVMDEKFMLLFKTNFKLCGEETKSLWALSLPVVLIVNGSQEPGAWATITWHNAFSDCVFYPSGISGTMLPLKPFVMCETVPWQKLAQVLDKKFYLKTGKGLSKEDLQYLAEKLLHQSCAQDYSANVTWQQFNKDPLPDRSFTFWDWFYAVMKVTGEYLLDIWQAGYLLGFVGRQDAVRLLSEKDFGTFLLRFSDSELGGVSIAFVREQEEQDGSIRKEVSMINPFNVKIMSKIRLVDAIGDMEVLKYLFPKIPKDDAFGSFYSNAEDEETGDSTYLKTRFVTRILGLSHMSSRSPHPESSPIHVICGSPDNSQQSLMTQVCWNMSDGNEIQDPNVMPTPFLFEFQNSGSSIQDDPMESFGIFEDMMECIQQKANEASRMGEVIRISVGDN